jgi:hypothetical protein
MDNIRFDHWTRGRDVDVAGRRRVGNAGIGVSLLGNLFVQGSFLFLCRIGYSTA